MLDAVIVGGGHNGLVAAAYLARAGLTVELFERRDLVGGACVTEELWPGVRASPGAYTLSLLRAQIIRDLDLPARGLHVDVHEPHLFAPLPDGRRVVTWSDRERTVAQLERDWSAADAEGYRAFAERWEAAAARARPLMLEPPDRDRWLEVVGPEFPSWPGREPWAGTIDIGFTLDDLARAAADAGAGRPAAAPWIEAACQTAADPTLVPDGRQVLSLFCQCFPPDADADAAADAAIARFAQACPGLPDRIVDRLALGPRELEARFGLTGGHIFHGDMLPGQLFEGRLDRRRFGGVEALYLGASGAHPGGAVTGAPGYLAAQAALEDLAK